MPEPRDAVTKDQDPAVSNVEDQDAQAQQATIPEPTATPTDATAETAPGTAEPAIDWERAAREYEARFKGLQTKLQREVEEKRTANTRIQELEDQMARASLEGLDPDEQKIRLELLEAKKLARELVQYRQETEPFINRMGKAMAAFELSVTYKVPKELLEAAPFNDRDAMEQYAKMLSGTLSSRQPKAPKPGPVESGSSVGTGGLEARLAELQGTGDIEGAMRIMDELESRRA